MSNFNKVVTNLQKSLSNAENDNLSQTLSAVRTAGGGGGGGTSYGGDGTYIEIVGNNTITLTTTAAEKLNREIPTTVAELTDSGDYATKDFSDAKYQTKDSMSAYLTTANAASTYQTKDSMSAYWTSAETNAAFAEQYSILVDAINSKQNKLTFAYDNDKISAINGSALAGQGGVTGDYYSASNPSGFINSTQAETQILAKHYITSGVSELDNFYSKTDTSSKTELQTKFDSLLNYNVTAAAGIEVTTATDAGIKTFGISMTAEPVVTDTRLSGYNGVAAALDTNVSGLWNVGLTHDMLNTINGKLDTTDFNTYTGTTAPATYQPKGDYYSASNPNNYVNESYITSILAGYAEWEDFENLSADVQNKLYASAAAQTYLTTTTYANDSATFVTKPDTTQTVLNNNYLIYSTLTDPTATTGWMPLSANYYSKTEADGRYQKKEDMSSYLTTAKYETDSATFVTSSSNTITGTKQYALTTNGWSDIGLNNYLPTSGGTVSGELVVSAATGTFDNSYVKCVNDGNAGYSRFGVGSYGGAVIKAVNGNNNVQVNVKYNANNNELIQVQKNGTDIGFLIPAVTANTTAGLTDDGILHIILES